MKWKYDIAHCNIKNCSKPAYGLLLCKKHYDTYITNNSIESIQLNVLNDEFTQWSLGTILRKLLYATIHYILHIRIRYIEHFPLETLFHYHFVYGRYQKLKISPVQFIKDFDYHDNIKIGRLKEYYDMEGATEKIEAFSRIPYGKHTTKVYVLCYLLFSIVFLLSSFYLKDMPNQAAFLKVFLIGCFALPILILGKRFINISQVLITDAADNKLYKTLVDNNQFLKDCQNITNRIYHNHEKYMAFLGLMVAIGSVLLITIGRETWDLNIYHFTTQMFLGATSIVMAFQLFNVLWMNIYVMPIILRFTDRTTALNINLYDLTKNYGWKNLRNFWKTYVLYDVFIFLSYFAILLWFRRFDIYILVYCFIIGGNISSVPQLIKMYKLLKIQFIKAVDFEKATLQNEQPIDFISRYQFIESLSFGFFQIKFIKETLFFTVPIILPFFIESYKKELIEILKLMFSQIFNIFV